MNNDTKQLSAIAKAKDTFRRIHFSNVFHCQPCKKIWMGKDLHKNRANQYVCLDCGHVVVDVTASPLGQSFLDLVMPDWRKA